MMLSTGVLILVISATLFGAGQSATSNMGRKFPGAFFKTDINQKSVQNAAEFAVKEIQTMSNSQFEQGLEKLVSAQIQKVEGGTNTKVQLIVFVSNCRPEGYKPKKTDPPAPSYCSVTRFKDCEAVVYEQPAKHITQLARYSCKPSKYTRQFATGKITQK